MALSARRLSLPVAALPKDTDITDSQVTAHVERMKTAALGRVRLNLNTNPRDIPQLEELLKVLAERAFEVVHLTFKYDFRFPLASNTSLDDALQLTLQSCPIKKFWGRLSGDALAAVPATVTDLYIGVGGEKHYLQLSSSLTNITDRLTSLDDLQIHIADHVDVTLLKPLPGVDFMWLYLSNISDANVDWAVKAALAMQPIAGSQRFTAIRFPGCSLSVSCFKTLLNGFKEGSVQTGGVWVSTKNIPRQYHQTLIDMTQDFLNLDLILLSESDIWRF